MAVLSQQSRSGSHSRPGVGVKDSQVAKILPAAYQHTSHIDLSEIRPMAGRVLIKDEHDDSNRNGIVIPDNIAVKDRNRIGVIVAAGAGDRWIEMEDRGAYGALRLKGITCQECNGIGYKTVEIKPAPEGFRDFHINTPCTCCGGEWCEEFISAETPRAFNPGNGLSRLPVEVQPGDRVLYTKRRECEIEIGGQLLTLAYVEQSILAVLEADEEQEAAK